MAAILHLTFTSNPVAEEPMYISARYLDNAGTFKSVNFRMRWKMRRGRAGEITVGPTISDSARNFITAFNLDYSNTGGTGNFQARPGSTQTKVDVLLHNSSWEFVSANPDTYLSHTIDNGEVTQTPKSVKLDGYNYATSTCATPVAILKVTGGTPPYNLYRSGTLVASNQSSPIETPLSRTRGSVYSFSVTDSNGNDVDSVNFKAPTELSSDHLSIILEYTEQGASVTAKGKFLSAWIQPYEYSIDGVNYSENNVFTGQPEGVLTVYMRDKFGCVVSKDVVIDGFSTDVETNFSVSDINPIRYSLVKNGKKNRYNTLSHEQLKNLPYQFIQNFANGDDPITQFKTNAAYINTFALGCDGTKYPLTHVKRSDHMGQSFKSTGTKFSTEDGKLGIYFGVVDVLDPLTDEVLESKDFAYQVPYAFNRSKALINIDGMGQMMVKEVKYDESYEAFVLHFETNYTGQPAPTTASTTYNIQNYEIYEFITPIADLPDEFFVVMEAGKEASNIEFTYMSEKIERIVDSDAFIEMIYWNTKNLGGMNYGTGVVHTLRLHTVMSRLSDEQVVQGYNGDTERYNTNHEVFDGEEFIFGYLSEEFARKLRLILTHDRLFINGVLYRLGDEVPDVNSKFTTNICELTAILRTGGDLTESFNKDVVIPVPGEGENSAVYELEQAIAAAKGKALILWKQ